MAMDQSGSKWILFSLLLAVGPILLIKSSVMIIPASLLLMYLLVGLMGLFKEGLAGLMFTGLIGIQIFIYGGIYYLLASGLSKIIYMRAAGLRPEFRLAVAAAVILGLSFLPIYEACAYECEHLNAYEVWRKIIAQGFTGE